VRLRSDSHQSDPAQHPRRRGLCGRRAPREGALTRRLRRDRREGPAGPHEPTGERVPPSGRATARRSRDLVRWNEHGRSKRPGPADARQYTSFWWAGGTEPDGWGLCSAPGRSRAACATRGGTGHTPAAAIDSRFYPGFLRGVDARIPDKTMRATRYCWSATSATRGRGAR